MSKSRIVERMAFSAEGLTAGLKPQNSVCSRDLLTHAGLCHREGVLLVALLERDLFAEGLLKQLCAWHRWGLPLWPDLNWY